MSEWSRRDTLLASLALGTATVAGCASEPKRRVIPAPNVAVKTGRDTELLNVALVLEHQAIFAYTLGGSSGLLKIASAEVADLFKGSHELHRDLLVKAIRERGGQPVDAQARYTFADPLANEQDVLNLALRLEIEAARAYISVLKEFDDRRLAESAGRILSDEVLHATVLRGALGRPPVPRFSFIES